jgi:hypothetical protein
VPLIPESEFLKTATEALRAADGDAHQRMLNRLQFELDERQRFALSLPSSLISHRLLAVLDAETVGKNRQVEQLRRQKEQMEQMETLFDILLKVRFRILER